LGALQLLGRLVLRLFLLVTPADEDVRGDLALLDALADLPQLVVHPRAAGERIHDATLAPLDAPRDPHLALTGEERDRAHLAQVHPHGVVGLFEGTADRAFLPLVVLVVLRRVLAGRGRPGRTEL